MTIKLDDNKYAKAARRLYPAVTEGLKCCAISLSDDGFATVRFGKVTGMYSRGYLKGWEKWDRKSFVTLTIPLKEGFAD